MVRGQTTHHHHTCGIKLMESEKICERTFSPSLPVLLPESLTLHRHAGWVVYVHAETARWCIVREGLHATAFTLLRSGLPLSDAIKSLCYIGNINTDIAEEVFSRVLIEIDDKAFYRAFSPPEQKSFSELRLYLTQACNLRCRHCYKFAGRARENELTQDEIESLIRQHAARRGESLLISGGEPLLRKDVLFKTLSLSHQLGLKSVLLTNGVLLSDSDVNILRDTVDEVQLSLDGPTPEIADYVRGEGNYDAVMFALERLVAGGIKVFLAMTPLPETLAGFERHYQSFVESIRSRFGDSVIFRMSRALEAGRDLSKPSRSYARKFERRIVAMEANALGQGYGKQIEAAFYDPGIRMTTCGIGCTLSVESDGNVYPCDLIQSKPLGNVRTDALDVIANRLLAVASRHSVDQSPVCRDCDLRYLCGGTCRLEGRILDGKWYPECSPEHKHHLLDTLIFSNPWRYECLVPEIAE